MNRRDTLKKMVVTTGGLIALPAWARGWNVTDMIVYPTSFSATEQELIAAVADAIIPPGNSIGALSVGVDKFLVTLIDKCYAKDVQDNVKVQLNILHKSAQRNYDKSFADCDQLQREELLLKLSTSEDKSEKDFFNLMKSETIRGFNTSKEVMTNYLNYKVAPGHYFGCVDVNT